MIKLKLVFGKEGGARDFEIVQDELLSNAVERSLNGIPLGKFQSHEVFNVTVNGLLIEKDFWPVTKLKKTDLVVLSPKIGGGDAGQLFKQAAIIAITVAATYYLGPAGASLTGAWLGVASAAVTIGATLLMNALIPPPVPDLGPSGVGGRDIDNSQMYAISGQSNQVRKLGTVPKVYGQHRMFPIVAANPYTELSVDPDTGETIQYLYCIYDFGLGVMDVSNLKIGDTPLTTDSFLDFEYRFVDPMKPNTDADIYDARLEKEFKNYKSDRSTTSLSLALLDGSEFTQFSDANSQNQQQELILDMVAPRGLFGFSSNGDIGLRSVKLDIQFALNGTEDWHGYNDVNYVDTFNAVGGTDVTDFNSQFVPLGDGNNEYYQPHIAISGGGYSSTPFGGFNIRVTYAIRPGTKKLHVPDDVRWEIGSKVFYGSRFLGIIETINDLMGGNTELVLDRVITNQNELVAYGAAGTQDFGGSPTIDAGWYNIGVLRSSRHELNAALVTGDRQAAVYASFRFTPKITGQYKVRVRRINAFGTYTTQTSDDLTWIGLTTAYKRNPISSTKRHSFLELKIRATNQLNGSIQNLSGEVSGVLPVYDPDTETWTRQNTNNPAWVFCDLLTGEVNKKALPISRLHMDSIVEWAEFCDTIPTPPPGGEFLEPRFQCNFVLDYETNLQGVLQQVGNAAQASLNIIDGKHGVLIDRNRDVPVQIFTPRNSKDFSSTRLYGPRPNGVKVKYIDPLLNWEVSEAIAYDNGYNAETATEFDELTAFACTNYEQAWRFGRYMIAQNRLRQETISLTVDFENLICTRGDFVQISQDVMRVGGTPARVKSFAGNVITIDDALDINPDLSYAYVYRMTDTGEIKTASLTPLTSRTFELDGDIPGIGDLIVIGEGGKVVFDCLIKSISPNDDMSATLTLVEKAEAIYDFESTDTQPDYDPQISATSNPDFYPPKAVQNLTVTDNFWECSQTQSGYNYFIELIWDIPQGSVYDFFEIWVNDGRGYRKFDTVTSKLFKYDIDQTRLGVQHGFKVVAVSSSGKKLDLIAMPEVLATPMAKTTPPSDIEMINLMVTNQVAELSWDAIADCDCSEYIVRFSPDINDSWESSTPLLRLAKNVNSTSVQARTGVYLVKAIDFGGRQSTNAARAITTIPNLFDLNIIETVNDAPTFDGSFVQTEELGDAVILQEAVPGDINTVQYYPEGYYEYVNLLELDDIYSVRLQSMIRADGYKKGELMHDWEHLSDVEHLNSALHSDWNVSLQYRATNVFAAMSTWEHLHDIEHLNFGAGVGFTEWRNIPTTGDATGRIFQFRVKLESLAPNVTPRLFDASVNAYMTDRTESFNDLISSASDATAVLYPTAFAGPDTTPIVQIGIDDGQTGDYWTFDSKMLEGFSIRFYDKNNVQVVRQFDATAKGFGHKYSSVI